jgi:hypothetical protein
MVSMPNRLDHRIRSCSGDMRKSLTVTLAKLKLCSVPESPDQARRSGPRHVLPLLLASSMLSIWNPAGAAAPSTFASGGLLRRCEPVFLSSVLLRATGLPAFVPRAGMLLIQEEFVTQIKRPQSP